MWVCNRYLLRNFLEDLNKILFAIFKFERKHNIKSVHSLINFIRTAAYFVLGNRLGNDIFCLNKTFFRTRKSVVPIWVDIFVKHGTYLNRNPLIQISEFIRIIVSLNNYSRKLCKKHCTQGSWKMMGWLFCEQVDIFSVIRYLWFI